MINSVSAQTLEFLYAGLLGVGLGVMFDVMRVLRSYIPRSRAITAVLDSLFWFAAIIALLAFTMTVSGGRMRWYVLLGAFSGGFVYVAALSEIIFKVMCAVLMALKRILSLLTRPIYLLLRSIWRTAKKSERKMCHKARNLRRERRSAKGRKQKKEPKEV